MQKEGRADERGKRRADRTGRVVGTLLQRRSSAHATPGYGTRPARNSFEVINIIAREDIRERM